MTDVLVQRLRTWERGAVGRPSLYDEAADALERLQQWKAEAIEVLDGWERAWVGAGSPGALGQPKSDALAEEVERLQADNQRLRRENERVDATATWALTELRAEVVRLQQALRDVLDVYQGKGRLRDAVAAARAVLEGNQQ